MTKELEDGEEYTNKKDREGFMTPDHPDAFLDLLPMPNPYKNTPAQKCIKCHGYGQWDLALNQYTNKQGYNRHFRAFCGNCNGYGWTRPEDHVHDWKFDQQLGRYCTRYVCRICNKPSLVDSSD